ncbi:hypothetical protein EHQ81_14570 [Leptospira selangorensis]|uniref:Uncharacterized protein n=1 Tax=Leptospira selangorensis TaxID=2484982 RepID=A0A5F2BX65_9LEPT|nr:hypothetical protein [Leptospira selangorensis]TGM12289.1 hypothetical protein EHQ81_14570 [Leptospira selangorensis]TGM14668.1 hypothetical protein EHQ82_18040 [Leptospira selangorensis]
MLVAHNVSCGLVLTGTDVGKEFLGLSEEEKKDPEKQRAALLSVLGVVSSPYLLQFNPPVLTLAQNQNGSFTASIKSPIPSEWSANSESILQASMDYINCPSQSSENSTSVMFSGSNSYASQMLFTTFFSSGNCVIEFRTLSTSSDINLPEGFLIGVLPVIVTPTAVVVGP